MPITTVALLVGLAGPVPSGYGLAAVGHIELVRDSAHTLFVPNAPDPGRPGQLRQLPQGGFGVTTGGTSHYQTLGMPDGGGIAVPNGNGTSAMMGSGGRIGTIPD
jgi:hypothetical protein